VAGTRKYEFLIHVSMGVDYVAKCLGYRLDGADVYESAKFGMDGRELL
jgi:hypothetical protein